MSTDSGYVGTNADKGKSEQAAKPRSSSSSSKRGVYVNSHDIKPIGCLGEVSSDIGIGLSSKRHHTLP